MTRLQSAAAVAAALGLAVLAPAATAQDPAAMLEAMPQAPANPPESVISDQYREIEAVVTEALPPHLPQSPLRRRRRRRSPPRPRSRSITPRQSSITVKRLRK